MWPVFIKRKCEMLGTLNTDIFLLLISFYIKKIFLLKDF